MDNIQRLGEAWEAYSKNASISDGHTVDCTWWLAIPEDCSCGLLSLEEAIKDVLNDTATPKLARRNA